MSKVIHCDTCICSHTTAVDGLNARARRLINQGKVKPTYPISPILEQALVDAPDFRLGWSDFRPSQANMSLVGWFLCGTRDKRYFACGTPPVGDPIKPFEYKAGDCFDLLGQSIHKEHIQEYFNEGINDSYLAMWLTLSLDALHLYVENAIGGVDWVNTNETIDGYF